MTTPLNSELHKDYDIHLALIAHDLKGIISKLSSLNNILVERWNHNDDMVNQVTKYFKSVCHHGEILTLDVLESYYLEQISLKNFSKEVFCLSEIVDEALYTYQLVSKEKAITVSSDCDKEKIMFNGNKSKIVRLLDNLFFNSLKFTQRGGEIKISVRKKNDKIILSVRDNGIGIPKGMQNDIFEKPSKTQRLGTENEKSTGLGMYLVKKIVDLHEGRIWIKSEEGKGTEFFIELHAIRKNN